MRDAAQRASATTEVGATAVDSGRHLLSWVGVMFATLYLLVGTIAWAWSIVASNLEGEFWRLSGGRAVQLVDVLGGVWQSIAQTIEPSQAAESLPLAYLVLLVGLVINSAVMGTVAALIVRMAVRHAGVPASAFALAVAAMPDRQRPEQTQA